MTRVWIQSAEVFKENENKERLATAHFKMFRNVNFGREHHLVLIKTNDTFFTIYNVQCATNRSKLDLVQCDQMARLFLQYLAI